MKSILCLLMIVGLYSVAAADAEPDPLATPAMRKEAPHAVELGWQYFDRGDYDTALRRFQIAVRMDSTLATGYYGIAYVYSVEDKIDDAIKYYRITLRYDQTYPYTYANLALAVLHKNQEREALLMLDRALQLKPDCGEAHYSYAQYYAHHGQWRRAQASANRAVDCGIRLDDGFITLLRRNGVPVNRRATGWADHPRRW